MKYKIHKWKIQRYYLTGIIYLSIPFFIGLLIQKFYNILFINNYDSILLLLDATLYENLLLLLNILKKNFMVLLLLYAGCVTKGITTKGVYIINGLIIGLSSGLIFDEAYLIMLILPHGIIEILVYVSAAGIGFINAKDIDNKKIINKIIWQSSLLIVGAFVEVFITPHIILLSAT